MDRKCARSRAANGYIFLEPDCNALLPAGLRLLACLVCLLLARSLPVWLRFLSLAFLANNAELKSVVVLVCVVSVDDRLSVCFCNFTPDRLHQKSLFDFQPKARIHAQAQHPHDIYTRNNNIFTTKLISATATL